MKVLYIVNQFPCLSETFVYNQIKGLSNLGHDVKVLAVYKGAKGEEVGVNYRCCATEKLSRLEQLCLLLKSFSIAILKFDPIIIEFIRLLLSFNLSGLVSLSLLRKQIYNYYDTECIIAHFGDCGYYAAMLKKFNIKSVKTIAIYHGYDVSVKKILEKWLPSYKRSFEILDFLLPISELWKNKLLSLGALPEKIIVQHMGININDFNFTSRSLHNLEIKYKTTRILSTGRFVEKKGFKYIVSAMQYLPECSLEIIGDGPLFTDIMRFIDDNNIKNVKCVGALKHNDVKNKLQECDIFCLPSVTGGNGDKEGIPVVLMEAMACGKIVVSTRHSGIPELIEDGVTGFLCEEKNVEELVEKIKFINSLGTRKKNIAVEARKKVVNDFNNEIIYADLDKIIKC